jgi:hypothetical protein
MILWSADADCQDDNESRRRWGLQVLPRVTRNRDCKGRQVIAEKDR